MAKKVLMIAGPNGAGKTTIAQELITYTSTLYEFINADEIAKSLAPKHPESMALTASKLMIKRLKELLGDNRDFAFETTAAGSNYRRHLETAKLKGYEINLCFLWLDSPQQAIERVSQRVKQGGHHISSETVHRRYYSGIKNLLTYYLPLADKAIIMDNSTEESKGKLIAVKKMNIDLEVLDKAIWEEMEAVAYGK